MHKTYIIKYLPFELWDEVTFSKWSWWIPALFAQNFSLFQRQKLLMDIKFFCCHPLQRARFSGNIWQEELAARFKKQRFRTASCLDAAGGRWGMGMSSMVGIGQGWDVLREPGLGKVYAPIWKYPEYIELQQQEIVQIINLFRKAQKRCEQRELGWFSRLPTRIVFL